MGRLVDAAVDGLVEQQARPLAVQMVEKSRMNQPHDSHMSGERDTSEEDEALSTLQTILFGTDRDQLQTLAADVDHLRHQVNDKNALAAAVAPILGEAIRRQIQDSREEIIDALYPVIGQIVMRAVTEAIRDLARSIDEKLQAATDFQRLGQRIKAIFSGVPDSQLALRSALPSTVQEVYLIHRESGLLLWHATRTGENSVDSELIGSMLTAIRDFAEQVLGGGKDHLHQLQFGDRELILEFARYSYVGVVMDGVTPTGFRFSLHQSLYAFEKESIGSLRHYNGEAARVQETARQKFEPFLSLGTEVAP
jgi:hypothetical protein